jgi:hypothetical protein
VAVLPAAVAILKALGLESAIVSALQMVIPVFTQIIVDRVVVEGDRTLSICSSSDARGARLRDRGDGRPALPHEAAAVHRLGDARSISLQRLLAADELLRDATHWRHPTPAPGMRTRVREFIATRCGRIVVGRAARRHAGDDVRPQSALVAGLSRDRARLRRDDVLLGAPAAVARQARMHGRYQSHQIDAIKGIETVKSMGAEQTFP